MKETILLSEAERVFLTVIEEGFNRGNFETLDDCFPERYTEHQYGLPETRAAFKRSIGGLRDAFPDLHLTVEKLVTHGDEVWARMTARGTHMGAYMGFAPTKKSFAITVMDVCRVEQGRIVEHWGVPDRFALLGELGMLPGPSK